MTEIPDLLSVRSQIHSIHHFIRCIEISLEYFKVVLHKSRVAENIFVSGRGGLGDDQVEREGGEEKYISSLE